MTAIPKTPLEIYKLLDKSNCRKCGEPSCLAFASAVSLHQRQLSECPQLPPEVAGLVVDPEHRRRPFEPGVDYLKQLQAEIAHIDLAAAAARTGGSFADGWLTLKVLGKDFQVNSQGNLRAEIHINPWIGVPLLNYILHGAGLEPVGVWVSLRELPEGRERDQLFQRQCEEPLRRLADNYPDLFDDLVKVFSGHHTTRHLDSDIAVVLWPLPKVPMLLCYWRPDDGLDSSLKVFFDATAAQNLDTDSAFTLGVGFTHMLKKIARRHGPGGAMSLQV